MRDVLIACETIKPEIDMILSEAGNRFAEIRWLQSGLHAVTKSLHDELQKQLDAVEEADHVVLGFGACGNSLAGLTTGRYQTIIPHVDDCISLLMGSYESKRKALDAGSTYFLSYGWMQGDFNLARQYADCVGKHGKQIADMVYQQLMGCYKYLGILETGVMDIESMMKETAAIADELSLEQRPLMGDPELLRSLLTGPWEDERFLCVGSNSVVDMDMLRIPASS